MGPGEDYPPTPTPPEMYDVYRHNYPLIQGQPITFARPDYNVKAHPVRDRVIIPTLILLLVLVMVLTLSKVI